MNFIPAAENDPERCGLPMLIEERGKTACVAGPDTARGLHLDGQEAPARLDHEVHLHARIWVSTRFSRRAPGTASSSAASLASSL